jgi:hypothetical protein
MEENLFTINVRINKNKFLRAFMNFDCLYYAIISKKHAIRLNLPRINILSRIMRKFEKKKKDITTTITSVIYANVNINEYERRFYFYKISYQNYDIIFGRF